MFHYRSRIIVGAAVVGFALGLSPVSTVSAVPLCADSGCEGPEECNQRVGSYCTLTIDEGDPGCTVRYCP